MNEPLITRKQLAEYYAVKPLTIKSWERQGMIKPFCVINGRPRYKSIDVANLEISKPITNGR